MGVGTGDPISGLVGQGLGVAMGGAQAAFGLGQMLFSGKKKAERELNALDKQLPTYEGSKPISTYYQTALQRYYTPPSQTSMYKRSQQNFARNMSFGLGAMRGRGGANANVNKLVRGLNDSSLNAEAAAEQLQNRNFQQLGGATNMMAQDQNRQFDINKMMPFQRKDRLAQMKLAAANARKDAGMANIAAGLGGAAMSASNQG